MILLVLWKMHWRHETWSRETIEEAILNVYIENIDGRDMKEGTVIRWIWEVNLTKFSILIYDAASERKQSMIPGILS